MVLSLSNRAEVVDTYEQVFIRSVNQKFALPKVLRLLGKFKHIRKVKFCRQNVFYRDEYQCQYCALVFKRDELTLDHVLPISRGGKTNWTNIVTACSSCNFKKGNKTPDEARMKLLKQPKELRWAPKFVFRRFNKENNQWKDWVA